MPIPDFQTLIRPLLDAHKDGKEHVNRDLVSSLADQFKVTETERRELLPSGRARLFDNRVGWAKYHLSRAGLITSPRRAISVITHDGLSVLKKHPGRINLRLLEELSKSSGSRETLVNCAEEESETPEEALENAYMMVRRKIEEELLNQIMSSPPSFLEQVVVDLVVRMGYGGSRKDAGEALGRSGDEGIDGIIKEDPLGLDAIYLQAKRWTDTVGRPEIQKFAGALQGQRARKGIFITTSQFSKEAFEYVSMIDIKIVLIDGAHLTKLMYDHNIGTALDAVFESKRIDTDYFFENESGG